LAILEPTVCGLNSGPVLLLSDLNSGSVFLLSDFNSGPVLILSGLDIETLIFIILRQIHLKGPT